MQLLNSTEPPDIEGTKRKNIIEMALGFTAMIRIFAKDSKERATTIKELDEEAYQALQSLLAKCQADSSPESLRNLHPVQYDDIFWRRLNRQ